MTIPPRWYCIDVAGIATLCKDEEDARNTATAADLDFPRQAPHIAAQLAPVASLPEPIAQAECLCDMRTKLVGDGCPGCNAKYWARIPSDVRAALLFALWHHQGGSSPVGQPIRTILGMGRHARLDDDQLAAAKRVDAALLACRSGSSEQDARDAEIKRLRGLLNSPELHDFARGVVLEAGHQRERWGNEHDAGKTPADWFWLVGYLAGKALHAQTAGNTDKALHHTISTAAALANWHGAILGTHNMRPGIDGDAAMSAAASAEKSS